jgi:sialic acid synthase SpsE
MNREMVVDGVRIADDTDTYIIAEIGNNHQGDLEKCKEMFKAAKQWCRQLPDFPSLAIFLLQ